MQEAKDEDRVAVERPYFITAPLTQQWFDKAVTTIKSQCPNVDYLSSSFNVARDS